MRITIVGAGYVGLATGLTLAYVGHKVRILELDESKLKSLEQGVLPFYEPYIGDLMEISRERLGFTSSYEEAIPWAEVVFIAVGTPPGTDGAPDLTQVRTAAEGIGRHLGSAFTVIANKSTVPVGSGNYVEALVQRAYQKIHGKEALGNFAVASNPEFLREGQALHDSLYPDRIVVGTDDPRALEVLRRVYEPILEQSFSPPPFLPRPEHMGAVPFITTDLASAELIKYAANAFLALKISFINEIASLAEKVGADVREVARAIGLDSRIGSRFLQAGLGWGGSCFPKDTLALLTMGKEYGLPMQIVAAAREVNAKQREKVVEKLQLELKTLKGRTIALLGLSFKPQTDDLRESPALELAKLLLERGAFVRAHDPVALQRAKREVHLTLEYAEEPDVLLRGVDAAILATDWPQYRLWPWVELKPLFRTPFIVDARNFLDREKLLEAGYRYVGIGIPSAKKV